MINTATYSGVLALFWLALFIYSISVIINRRNFGSKVQQGIQIRGLTKQSKLSSNTLLQLIRIAPTFFSTLGITTTSIESVDKRSLSWLWQYKTDEFAIKVYQLKTPQRQTLYVMSIYDLNAEVKKRLVELILANSVTVYSTDTSMTYVFENSPNVLEDVTNIIDRLGGVEASGDIYQATAVRLKKYLPMSVFWRWSTLIFLTLVCFSLSSILLHGLDTQSLNLYNSGVITSYFLEDKPRQFVFLLLMFGVALLIICAHLVLCWNWKNGLSRHRLTALAALLAIGFVGFQYVVYPDRENIKQVEEKRLINAAKKQRIDISHLPDEPAETRPIPLMSPHLLALLYKQDYAQLNREFDHYHALVNQDIGNELMLESAYSVFAVPDDKIRSAIFSWQIKEPENAYAKLAQAYYLFAQAWHVRGNGYASSISPENLSQMRQLMEQSYTLAQSVMTSQQHAMVAGALAIRIRQVLGNKKQLTALFHDLISLEPASYILRHRYLLSLRPKWRGSCPQMQQVIDDMQPYLQQNPQLNVLRGAMLVEAGDIAAVNKSHFEAKSFYQAALRYGHNDYVLTQIGKSEYRLQNYQQALEYFNSAIQLKGNAHVAYYWRSKSLHKLKRPKEAHIAQQVAMSINAHGNYYQSHLQRLTKILKEQEYRQYYGFDANGTALSASQNISSNGYVAYQQALRFIEDKDYDDAVVLLVEAINSDPHVIDYYIALDMLLSQQQKWSTIITFWERYLELYPLNPRAHREIAGSYYHNLNQDKFVIHMRKAAELGDEEAIRILARNQKTQ